LNQTQTSYTPNTVSVYGPYLKSQRSKNCKICGVGKKLRFSTISPEIEIFEFTSFLPQIWPQCLGRKEFKSEKETVLIPAGVKRPQYKRKKEGSARKRCIHKETLK